MSVLLFVAGLVALILGADALVKGASNLAASFGIPSLIIGLTVVAFGTSSPELAVSIGAAWSGQTTMALGNVVGSNVFNVLFILGVSALIVPMVVSRQLIRLDVPLMIGLSIGVWVLALDGRLGWIDGGVLVLVLIAYFAFLIRQGRHERGDDADDGARPPRQLAWNLVRVGVGLALLVLGSRWLVSSAVTFAEALGVSELVIGLTIVAAGTSLPEVVTSIMAAMKGERDIAVGNVVGSNLFNIMGVLGLAAVVAPDGLAVTPAVLRFDLPVMMAVAIACLPIFFTGGVISRLEGGVLFGYYLAYTAYLILAASHHEALPAFSGAMLWFVGPLTVLGLVVSLRRSRTATSTG
ncbi:cation:H+ antiporter [Tamilnaduibacter salinus]|uniref:Cation:H+ antiporter n=1 Tax=Tamilnaduibacter salinus TaxID=1484056 RepID=A0A2A2I6D8_9GAMM|nr:calcium/sodium antiporter [Tamilnaduibacter salinus]PAV26844.1 sodium:calcium antiporter [Tamilnaduibacter salinus]PVY77513.1 cation:H+ antiporter [Tamilnaduibacter salinus]